MVLYAAILIVVAIFAITVKYLKRKARPLKGKQIPHQSGIPVFGMGLEINESNSIYKFEEMAKRYGEIFSLNLFGMDTVVLNTESLLRKAYCSDKYAKYFNDKPQSGYAKYFRRSGDSVGFAADGHGKLHRHLKKTYMKALHTYGNGIKKLEVKVMVELNSVINSIDNMETKEFDFVGFLKRSLTNIVALVLVGETIPDGDPEEDLFWHQADTADFFISHYAESIMSIIPFMRHLTFTTFGKLFQFGMDINKRIADKFFFPYQKIHQDGNDQGIVNFYLEQQKREKKTGKDVICTDDRIISTIVETVDAGVLSTWSVITNSMLVLLNHPEYQTKIQDEIDRVIGHKRLPTFTDRMNCPYILAFEKEIHRYIPVTPLLLPHVCNEDIEFEGYNIKKNTMIIPNTWFVHHDENIWGDPWNFRPERFLDEHGALLPSEHLYCRSVIPFGLGNRRCPGEMFGKTRYFLYISTLLQQYSFETPDGATQRSCDPRKTEDFDSKLTLRAKPFMVRAVKR